MAENTAVNSGILEDVPGDLADSKGSCSFSSWETSTQRIVDRVMSESASEEGSLRNSGRSSFSSGPMAGASNSTASSLRRLFQKKKDKMKEENRPAQLQACVSVAALAGVAAAVAAAAKASSSCPPKDQELARTDVSVASAAELVAAQCFEAAEALGADRNHLESVVSSAVNVQSADFITALTAAATEAVGRAEAIALKDVSSMASFLPMEKGPGAGGGGSGLIGSHTDELPPSKLLKRTRNGDLHEKDVSVYINRNNRVILKMESKYVRRTINRTKEYTVLEVVTGMPAWAGRHLLEGGENLRYFGLKTVGRGLVEFECKSQREYEAWTDGVSRLISLAAAEKSKVK